MLEAKGTYNKAKIFTDTVDETALAQITELCNQPFVEGESIRIMPDTHAGAGCTIGTTMTIRDKIVPNLVGVDIGCGMEVAIMKQNKADVHFDQLDETIRSYVPNGFGIRQSAHPFAKEVMFDHVRAPFKRDRAEKSIGTLGGGNHFIELNEWDDHVVLVIHSGSRNLGKQIAEYYQNRAYDELSHATDQRDELITRLKQEGRQAEIEQELARIKQPFVHKDLAYLQGDGFNDYMNDMAIAQHYAALNRKAMIDEIVQRMNWQVVDGFTTIHNYIDMEQRILRKGAISAQKDERVIIPINMRDGSIIATGKGNADWNYSGPHGAGRLMSRSKAKKTLQVGEFRHTMQRVWSTSVSEQTLDEAPMAYKPLADIIKHTKDTIDVTAVIKPLYNFKAN
ncbi:RtcB protein [Bacillus sp. JCM 19046]|nr:RtcB protein [Bacillus sp. JCM 19045]GAF19730.1 RtcB protein [Bacillus sp. JCM 19046]